MCTTCGCGSDTAHVEGRKIDGPGHWHKHADGRWHRHEHADPGHRDGPAEPSENPGPVARLLASPRTHPAAPAERAITVEQALLAKNDAIAAQNRRYFNEQRVFALNLVSSPGSGKTSLLVRTIEAWADRTPIAVIEGDQQTSRDAARVRAAGARAVQINTGKGCHLDAQMVAAALSELSPVAGGLLLIENVGNLVCPAMFDLGEAHKVVILSVTEGEDKPLKYPDMFHASDLMVLSKVDLLPHVEFDAAKALEYARRARPDIEMIALSSKTSAGFDAWLGWLERGVAAARHPGANAIDVLRGGLVSSGPAHRHALA